jgi:flagellar motility protein MotE (MotC chaperone)
VSDTPRTDAAYAASTGAGIYELFKESQDIERELNEANKTNRLQYELITTAEKRGVDKSKEELNRLNDRIKQLEAKVDELHDLEKWLEGR